MAKKSDDYTDAREWARNQTGGYENTSLLVPDGVSFFTPKKDKIRIDIASYRVGEGNPNADAGKKHYERTYYIHRNLGPQGKDSYVCLWDTFKEKCPACEEVAKLRRKGGVDAKTLKEMEPKIRQLWLVMDLTDDTEKEKGWQLWDVSYHLFGKLLKKMLESQDDDDNYHLFARMEEGLTLKVSFENRKIDDSQPFKEAKVIEFKDRQEQYEESLVDELPCLDECIRHLTYAEFKKILDQEPGEGDDDKPAAKAKPKTKPADDDDDDDKPAPKVKSKPAPKDDDDDDKDTPVDEAAKRGIEKGKKVKHKEHGVCTVVHVSADGTSLRIEDESGEIFRAIAPEDCTVVKKAKPVEDDDDEDEKPKAKKKKDLAFEADEDEKPKKSGKSKPKDDDDDD